MIFKVNFKSLLTKGLFIALLLLQSPILATENERDPLPFSLSQGDSLELDLPKNDLPSIIVIDKTLGIKAEFFGKMDEIKTDFKPVFEKTKFILEHNNQRIYLITN